MLNELEFKRKRFDTYLTKSRQQENEGLQGATSSTPVKQVIVKRNVQMNSDNNLVRVISAHIIVSIATVIAISIRQCCSQ